MKKGARKGVKKRAGKRGAADAHQTSAAPGTARGRMPGATRNHDELLPEYDRELIRRGVRGKYAERYGAGTNVIVLEPDVAAAFPDAEAVNAALRALLVIARRQTGGRAPVA